MHLQRFTLLHEFKHIIDHGQTFRLYSGDINEDEIVGSDLTPAFRRFMSDSLSDT